MQCEHLIIASVWDGMGRDASAKGRERHFVSLCFRSLAPARRETTGRDGDGRGNARAALGVRRGDVDVEGPAVRERANEREDPGGVDAVVVHDEDARAVATRRGGTERHGASAAEIFS
jgi:hypothetical protein